MNRDAWPISIALIALATMLPGTIGAAQLCPSYSDSAIYRKRDRQINVNPDNWIHRIENAVSGEEFLLSDGFYSLDRYALNVRASITIRSSSGRREAVVIQGRGYGQASEGFKVLAPEVTIADLTITQFRNHGISIKGESGANSAHIYNVHILDIGTQHIKGTPNTSHGIVACSSIGYSPGAVRGDYINAIDIHGAMNWSIHDNEIYNIWGDGTGCEVDVDCGRYYPGGGPAILLWNNAAHNSIERNRIIDCFRGIALGFTDQHLGGRIQNNFIVQTVREQNRIGGDAGISIRGTDVLIDHNTVILESGYRGAIEVQDSARLKIRNNLLSSPVWNRGRSTFMEAGTIHSATLQELESPLHPHLAMGSIAIDPSSSVQIHDLETDIDLDPRLLGTSPDAGCDEATSSAPDPFQ